MEEVTMMLSFPNAWGWECGYQRKGPKKMPEVVEPAPAKAWEVTKFKTCQRNSKLLNFQESGSCTGVALRDKSEREPGERKNSQGAKTGGNPE